MNNTCSIVDKCINMYLNLQYYKTIFRNMGTRLTSQPAFVYLINIFWETKEISIKVIIDFYISLAIPDIYAAGSPIMISGFVTRTSFSSTSVTCDWASGNSKEGRIALTFFTPFQPLIDSLNFSTWNIIYTTYYM